MPSGRTIPTGDPGTITSIPELIYCVAIAREEFEAANREVSRARQALEEAERKRSLAERHLSHEARALADGAWRIGILDNDGKPKL